MGNIPGNTAKAHGRGFSSWLFFKFASDGPDNGKKLARFLKACRAPEHCWHTSMLEQLQQWIDYSNARCSSPTKQVPQDAPVAMRRFGNVLLTPLSLSTLDPVKYAQFLRSDGAFKAGMSLDLGEKSAPAYENTFAVGLFLAGNTRATCNDFVAQARGLAEEEQHGLVLACQEDGFVWRPEGPKTPMREPFGFRDGLSNLLFLQEDVTEFNAQGTNVWSPEGEWTQLLFQAGNYSEEGTKSLTGGSYVVLRKLEQNVLAFREWESDQQRSPDGPFDAGIGMVGRTRDGCPLTGLPPNGRLNNFHYDGETAGRCPINAHIRKANPRGSSDDVLNADTAESTTAMRVQERHVLFARRGMVYADNDNLTLADRPDVGVGLLFSGYMGSIDGQFRHMQVAWLNGSGLPNAGSGPDPLTAASFVRPMGGGYFFTPPISWFDSLPS